MLKYDVLCIGSATVDNFLTINQPISSIKIGDKILADETEIHSGGGSTNSAAALAKLGLKVKVFTKLGRDHNADYVEKELREYKIKNICKHLSKKNTDSSVIVSSIKERDRVIFAHKGASRDLSIEDLPKNKLNTRWIYLATLLGKSFNTAKKIAEIAKKKKIKMLFNPSLYLAKRGRSYLKNILKATTIIVLNKEEAQALLKTKKDSMKFLLTALHNLGPKTVLITNGTKKLYAYHENKTYILTPPNIKPKHTAGAGDAFTAGFLAGVIKNYDFKKALQTGQANASSVIQHLGTKNKLLTQKEADSFIKKHRIKVKVS